MRTSPDDLLSMAFFVRVVDARSFTGAARELGVSKSLVSGRIAKLEEKIGTRLLHRTTRRIALTADGVRMYERCARVLAAADEASESFLGAQQVPIGLLRVNAPAAFAERHLAAPIAEFLALHPALRIELDLSTGTTDLLASGVDLGIRIARRLADSAFRARKVGSDRLVACAAPEYLRRKGIPWRPQDLVHHDCLAYSVLRRGEEMHFVTPEGPVELVGAARLVSDSAAFLRASALAGAGLVVMPLSYVAEEIAARRLRTVLDEFIDFDLSVFAINVHGGVVPAKVRLFIEHLARSYRVAPWMAVAPAPARPAPARPAPARRKTRR